MDAEILQKLVDLAREQHQTWIKLEIGLYHNAHDETEIYLHLVRGSEAETSKGRTIEEAYENLKRKLRTGED